MPLAVPQWMALVSEKARNTFRSRSLTLSLQVWIVSPILRGNICHTLISTGRADARFMQFYRLGSSSRLGSSVDQLDSQFGLQWCDLRLDLVGAQLGLLAAGPVLHDPGLLVGTRMDFALPGHGMDLQRRRKGRTHAQPPLPVALADSTAFDTGKIVRPQRKHVPVQSSVEVVRARIRLAATFRVRGFADWSERRRPRLTRLLPQMDSLDS